MQIFNTFFNANLDFSLFYSYISSFSLNYFVLFADLIETSIPQLLNYVGYSTNPNPQRLITNKTIVDLIIDESDIVFFSSYKYMNYSVFSDSFVRNLISAANGESFFHNNLEAVLSMLNISFNYIGIGLSVLYLILVFFFFFILFFTLFYQIPQQLFGTELFLLSLDSSYGLVEAEKEVGALEDILLPLFLILSVSIGWFFLLLPHQVINTLSPFTDSIIILFFCCIIVSLPINLLYECGFFFSTFFRGSAGSTSTLMELVYDLIANTTMFARMQVQHVRVLLGLAMYIETATYIETLSLNQLLGTPQFTNLFNWTKFNEHHTNSGLSFICDVILQIATLIGEIGHYILFLLQSSASYAALIFWLFSLLYSGFFKDLIEIYFVYKNLK